MKYAVEMGSGSMIFIKSGSGIQKLTGGDTRSHTQTNRKQSDHVSLLLIFQNKKYGL
jgi:hypothetical protein